MDLPEQIPPGRANRKLRGYVAEVKMLHEAGYSITGIHQVLASKGIKVGRSAVVRELAKLSASASTPAPKVAAAVPEKTPIETDAIEPQPASKPTENTKEKPPTADEFFATYIDNPLIRRKKRE